MTKNDTIAAIATAAGGGVGVVRASGENLKEWAEKIVGKTLKPRVATLANITDEKGEIIDQALVLFFPAPASLPVKMFWKFKATAGAWFCRWC